MQDTPPGGDFRDPQSDAYAGQTGALAFGELRRLFDYYISAVGVQSIVAIAQRIRTELEWRLPPPQAQNAQRLLGLYLEFKRKLVELNAKPELSGNGVQAIRNRLLTIQDLRALLQQ